MSTLQAVIETNSRRLAEASTLFEAGRIDAARGPENFIRRLNTRLAANPSSRTRRPPAGLSEALRGKGTLNRHAELVVFGRWLLIEGQPGARQQGGRRPDPRMILRCTAAAILELHHRAVARAHKRPHPGRRRPRHGLTKHDLARHWKILFGESRPPSFFDAKLRSMRLVLAQYRAHLRSGKALQAGRPIRKSPEIEQVLHEISGGGSSSAPPGTPPVATKNPLTPQAPGSFRIALEYATDAEKTVYRNLSGASLPPTILRYDPHRRPRPRQADAGDVTVFKPQVDLRAYRVAALIDRVALLLTTGSPVKARDLQVHLSTRTGVRCFVQDLTLTSADQGWGVPLPVPDLSKSTGRHFALMVQDPTPQSLADLLRQVVARSGIDGEVALHLVEVAVDFHPVPSSPETALALRERMVGLLQRHHWLRHELFRQQDIENPRLGDPRQIHGKTGTPRFLFAHSGARGVSDRQVGQARVRDRIAHAKPGTPLFVNATLCTGARTAPAMVSIQHKIADRRNPARQSLDLLDTLDRRARIEVTLSGAACLQARHLNRIEDLGTVSFRKLTRPFFCFQLPESEPFRERLEDIQIQMRSRGVYGVELRNLVRDLEERRALRSQGHKLPRRSERHACGLQPWDEMQEVVGRALDGLKRRWTGFSVP